VKVFSLKVNTLSEQNVIIDSFSPDSALSQPEYGENLLQTNICSESGMHSLEGLWPIINSCSSVSEHMTSNIAPVIMIFSPDSALLWSSEYGGDLPQSTPCFESVDTLGMIRQEKKTEAPLVDRALTVFGARREQSKGFAAFLHPSDAKLIVLPPKRPITKHYLQLIAKVVVCPLNASPSVSCTTTRLSYDTPKATTSSPVISKSPSPPSPPPYQQTALILYTQAYEHFLHQFCAVREEVGAECFSSERYADQEEEDDHEHLFPIINIFSPEETLVWTSKSGNEFPSFGKLFRTHGLGEKKNNSVEDTAVASPKVVFGGHRERGKQFSAYLHPLDAKHIVLPRWRPITKSLRRQYSKVVVWAAKVKGTPSIPSYLVNYFLSFLASPQTDCF